MKSEPLIPFNLPVRLGSELETLSAFLNSGGQQAGGGPAGVGCEKVLSTMLGKPVLLTTSATHALELAALLANVGAGDEVIVPSYTFVSTANAFVLRGARPVFADVDLSGNLLPSEVRRLRGPRTKAVCVVHYAGNCCDMEALRDAAGRLSIIEDAAQAIGARHHGRPLGSIGATGAISFHETKNVGCGEGGALVLGDEALLQRAEIIREKGTNRRMFQLGLVDKYTWVDVGSSYVLAEMSAAFLLPQLTDFDVIQARRAAISRAYSEALGGITSSRGIRVICTPRGGEGNHHLFGLILHNEQQRNRFIAGMRSHGVVTPFHYQALHQSKMGQRFHDGSSLPNSEALSVCLARLPLYFNLTDELVDRVIDAARAVISEF